MGGSGPSKENPYQEKLRWSKKGGGGEVSVFFIKIKKNIFYAYPSHNHDKHHVYHHDHQYNDPHHRARRGLWLSEELKAGPHSGTEVPSQEP